MISPKDTGICELTWIPVRSAPDSKAEICTSLLFGEKYIVISVHYDWLFIKIEFDNYQGFISKNQFSFLNDKHERDSYIQTPFATCNFKNHKILLPAGAEVNKQWAMEHQLAESDLIEKSLVKNRKMTDNAMSFLEIPYLWGGRCFAGIDCSGFIQVLGKLSGKNLQRDASMQAKQGSFVEYNMRKAGDLVFFQNDNGKIIHVGLLLSGDSIIHAHGKVRIDLLNELGIVNNHGYLTHNISFIKRLE